MAETAKNLQGGSQAWMLSLAGFLPFVCLLVAMAFGGRDHPMFQVLLDGFRTYSAVILSFLGGIRWGMTIEKGSKPAILAASTVPSLAGWFALFLSPAAGIALALLAFCAQGAWDSLSFSSRPELQWFARLRVTLTLLVAAAHAVALMLLVG